MLRQILAIPFFLIGNIIMMLAQPILWAGNAIHGPEDELPGPHT